MGRHRLTVTTTPTEGGLGSLSGSRRLGLLWHVSGFRAGRWVAVRCSLPCARFPAPERARASPRPTGQGAQTRGGRVQVILPESGDLGFLSFSPYRLQFVPRSLTIKPNTQLCSPGPCSHPQRAGQLTQSCPHRSAWSREASSYNSDGGAWLSLRSHTSCMDTA